MMMMMLMLMMMLMTMMMTMTMQIDPSYPSLHPLLLRQSVPPIPPPKSLLLVL
jgi:hypothetical protein